MSFNGIDIDDSMKRYWCYGLVVRCWIHNVEVPSCKPPGGTKVTSAFDPTDVNQRRTRTSLRMSGEK